VALFVGLALALWLCWAALDLSIPQALHHRLSRLSPEYEPNAGIAQVLFACALLAAWAWTVYRFPEGPERPVVMWASGMTMGWGLFSVLFNPYLDTAKSYRQMVADLRSQLPAEHQCIGSRGLGEPQRAMLQYFAGISTYRDERSEWRSRPCHLLLVQGSRSRMYQPDAPWLKVWEGGRPGDQRELYQLYRLPDQVEGSKDPEPEQAASRHLRAFRAPSQLGPRRPASDAFNASATSGSNTSVVP